MLIGVLGDTHDRLDTARAGVEALLARGAKHLIHTGDVGSEKIIDLLVGQPATLVWGNNDFEREALGGYAKSLGVEVCDERLPIAGGRESDGAFGAIELDGKRIAITHGDDDRLVRQLLASGTYDYLFTGHSHIPHDRTQGRTRWINPGALYRAARKTVATLDLESGRLEWIAVN